MTRVPTRRLADVARKVGVSEATVSRVLNGKAGVSDSTREAVLTALDVLGYERPTKLRGERARADHAVEDRRRVRHERACADPAALPDVDGTSFSAPLLATHFVRALLAGRPDPPALARETLARHDGLADFAFAMQGLGSGAISLAGTAEQATSVRKSVRRSGTPARCDSR